MFFTILSRSHYTDFASAAHHTSHKTPRFLLLVCQAALIIRSFFLDYALVHYRLSMRMESLSGTPFLIIKHTDLLHEKHSCTKNKYIIRAGVWFKNGNRPLWRNVS